MPPLPRDYDYKSRRFSFSPGSVGAASDAGLMRRTLHGEFRKATLPSVKPAARKNRDYSQLGASSN